MELRDKIDKAIDITEKETTVARHKSKEWFDKNALIRELKVGQFVLFYLPIEGIPLAKKFHGPYEIIEKTRFGKLYASYARQTKENIIMSY